MRCEQLGGGVHHQSDVMSTFAERITTSHDPVQIETSLLGSSQAFAIAPSSCSSSSRGTIKARTSRVSHLDLRQLEVPVQQVAAVLLVQAVLGKLTRQ